jgi:hypothetical protein
MTHSNPTPLDWQLHIPAENRENFLYDERRFCGKVEQYYYQTLQKTGCVDEQARSQVIHKRNVFLQSYKHLYQ